MQNVEQPKKSFGERFQFFLKSMGPGIITGAADDDPSGIGTYTAAGSQFGTKFLFAALLTWPLMAATQMACARIGLVTGRGLASLLRIKFHRSILILICVALFIANTFNVSADLAAMADSAEMLTGYPSGFYILLFGVLISWATIYLRYQSIVRVLKWLTVSLFAYMITAFMVVTDWRSVLKSTVTPHLPRNSAEWGMLVALLGTTISPYLFFWQASQEVEEEKAHGQKTLAQRRHASATEILMRKIDVGVGTFFSNLVMYFIILTTAAVLNAHGLTSIETSQEAARALEPIAGKLASFIYTLGVLGVGFLAIPTLTGSTAYALAETFNWKQGLDAKWNRAKTFYKVIIISTVLAIGLDFIKMNPIKALYWSAVINGLLAPFLLLAIWLVIRDNKIMLGQPSSQWSQVILLLTTIIMFVAGVGMFVF